MTRLLIRKVGSLKETRHIDIKLFRRRKPIQFIEYHQNLGSVSKIIYTETKYETDNYLAKNYKEQVRKNKEAVERINKKKERTSNRDDGLKYNNHLELHKGENWAIVQEEFEDFTKKKESLHRGVN